MKKKQVKQTVAVVVCVGLALMTQVAFAQGGIDAGVDGINQATTAVNKYFDPMTKLFYIFCALLGLWGGYEVYSKWNSGAQDTQQSALRWGGSLIFAVVVITILRAFFL